MSSRNLVIVRAHGGEPVPLWVSKIAGERVVVTNEVESNTLSLPARSVFAFDEDLLTKLLGAYKDGDTYELGNLWDQAEPYLQEKVLQ